MPTSTVGSPSARNIQRQLVMLTGASMVSSHPDSGAPMMVEMGIASMGSANMRARSASVDH
jgi:hypothetical protein